MTELVKAKNANADLLLKLKELQQKALIENARTNALQRKAEEKAKQAAPSSLARYRFLFDLRYFVNLFALLAFSS